MTGAVDDLSPVMSAHHIIVGMSGGVDSAVAALLLSEQGHKVSGLFMKNWEEDDDEDYCAAADDLADAQSVCDHLGIDLLTVNFSSEYWDRVFKHFLAEYEAGRGIPKFEGRVQRFDFSVNRIVSSESFSSSTKNHFPEKIRLNWYHNTPVVRAGERWSLRVRLKPPHGLLNPGGFDYEKWLFQQGIQAKGYVRHSPDNKHLEPMAFFPGIDSVRQNISENIHSQSSDYPLSAIISALAVGDRSKITARDWQVFLRTGTNHLVAISGLHIGLIAGFAWFLSRRLYPSSFMNRLSAQQFSALMSLIAGFLYSMLAGFSIPTQRALIMLLVVMGAILLKRQVTPIQTLGAALLAVLLWDPVCVLSPGFWFSFLAVLAIVAMMSGRVSPFPRWLQLVRIQIALTLVLMPIGMNLFHGAVLISPLANLILVPWVSMLVVPMVLLGLVINIFSVAWSLAVFALAENLLSIIWPLLEWMSWLPLARVTTNSPPLGFILLAISGAFILLLPRGLPGRVAGLVLLLPACTYTPRVPAVGDFDLHVLDVGQGLAVIVRTHEHVLVYDAGARLGAGFDMGQFVVLPFLNHNGIRSIDQLLVSHGDNDHIGGANSILDNMAVDRVLGSDIDVLDHMNKRDCIAGIQWRWDGVDFRVLHPDKPYSRRNNRSCVVQISNGRVTALLAGDIEAVVERQLVRRYGQSLRSDFLVVPHHGSRSSSTQAFLQAVSPHTALVSAGYRNRYGFPKVEVTRRYENLGATLVNTSSSGAITVHAIKGASPWVERARQRAPAIWRHLP